MLSLSGPYLYIIVFHFQLCLYSFFIKWGEITPLWSCCWSDVTCSAKSQSWLKPNLGWTGEERSHVWLSVVFIALFLNFDSLPHKCVGHLLMISFAEATQAFCSTAPWGNSITERATALSPNPHGSSGTGLHDLSSAGLDWFGCLSAEQPDVAADSMEIYKLRLDFDFVNNMFP